MVSVMISLLVLNLQEQGSEAELLDKQYKTLRENKSFLLQFSHTSAELILILHPHFHMKTLQVTVIYHYFLLYSELIVQIPSCLTMVHFYLSKSTIQGP